MHNPNGEILRQVFTPETLARRWVCSARHVRNLIKVGELKAFRVGGKLLRIRAQDVEEVERCSGELDDIEGNGQPSPEPEQAESVVRLARIERTLREQSTV